MFQMKLVGTLPSFVIPAKAGIHLRPLSQVRQQEMDPRVRGGV
jgi:hypothetical protein